VKEGEEEGEEEGEGGFRDESGGEYRLIVRGQGGKRPLAHRVLLPACRGFRVKGLGPLAEHKGRKGLSW
jgi:hypothetical protein